jgi:hypothetical protein
VGFLPNSSIVASSLSNEPLSKLKPVVVPSRKRWCIRVRPQTAKVSINASAGQGFRIKNKASDIAWAEEYKAYLRKSGEGICRMAMEGHKKVGFVLVICLCLAFPHSPFRPKEQPKSDGTNGD